MTSRYRSLSGDSKRASVKAERPQRVHSTLLRERHVGRNKVYGNTSRLFCTSRIVYGPARMGAACMAHNSKRCTDDRPCGKARCTGSVCACIRAGAAVQCMRDELRRDAAKVPARDILRDGGGAQAVVRPSTCRSPHARGAATWEAGLHARATDINASTGTRGGVVHK